MARGVKVERPTRKGEFRIEFASREARVGWDALNATQKNSLVDAWEVLTVHPLVATPTTHPLRGSLAVVVRDGASFARWQYELRNGARIWYYVDGSTVHLEQVHTHHPNQTK